MTKKKRSRNQNKIVILNKGRSGHTVGGVFFAPGKNEKTEKEIEIANKEIANLEEAGKDEVVDMLREDIKFEESFKTFESESKYDFSEMKPSKIKSLIEECFDSDDLKLIVDTLERQGKVSDFLNKAITKQLGLLENSEKK